VTIRLAQPNSEESWRQARQLIEEYAASLNLDLSFQNFAYELEHQRNARNSRFVLC
jgi:hypothetical protein